MLSAVLVFTLVGTVNFLSVNGQTCKMTLQNDLPLPKEPLILCMTDQEGQPRIVWPEVVNGQGVLSIEPWNPLLLACTGKDNITGTGQQTSCLSCNNGVLMVGSKVANKTTISCSQSYAQSAVKVYQDICGSGEDSGIKTQIGFQLNASWIPLVEICHNISRSSTLYSAHEIQGQSLLGAIKSSDRKDFSKGPKPLFPEVSPDAVYAKSGQEKAFAMILGSAAAKYLNNTCFLARGHLAPDADLIYYSGQMLTYYYVNVAPQWQGFNAGNWLGIESAVRTLASKMDETLRIFTGTIGVLSLADENGVKRTMYLEPNKSLIPVPDIFWKLVQIPSKLLCTVVIGHNNVFLTQPPSPICSTASPYGWPSLTNLAKGYTYYCDYQSFKRICNFVPDISCNTLLEFP